MTRTDHYRFRHTAGAIIGHFNEVAGVAETGRVGYAVGAGPAVQRSAAGVAGIVNQVKYHVGVSHALYGGGSCRSRADTGPAGHYPGNDHHLTGSQLGKEVMRNAVAIGGGKISSEESETEICR